MLYARENADEKVVITDGYRYKFFKADGFFARCGDRLEDDPQMCPLGCEILDIEISTNGCPNNCRFCYKGNTNKPATNMSLATYQKVMDKMPCVNGVPVLTQVALGLTGIKTNAALVPIMEYTRSLGIVPNFTISGVDLTSTLARATAKLLGATAISCYQTNKQVCYNTVAQYLDLGVKQTNIHLLYHQDNLDFVYEILRDTQTDNRLRGLNAIVLLGLKNKGRASEMKPCTQEQFNNIAAFMMDNDLRFGFDSCSAGKFDNYVNGYIASEKLKKEMLQVSERCEAFCMSGYISVDAKAYPCSFTEGTKDWEDGIDVLSCDDFLNDIWFSQRVLEWRKKLLANERKCPVYKLD